MHDEINQDLDGLRVVAPTDQRDFDTWAFDDKFIEKLLADTFGNRHQKKQRSTWQATIEMYWRKTPRMSRREVADALGQSLDTVKSRITKIRQTAKAFLSCGAIVRVPETDETSCWPGHATLIERPLMWVLAGGSTEKAQEAADIFTEEYRRLTTINQLRLFHESISGNLIDLLKHSDALGVVENQEIVKEISAKADKLKRTRQIVDAFEGRTLQICEDQRTRYKPDGRGRPRKPQSVKVKRPRGRPRKNPIQINITAPITDAPVASELFLLPGGQQFCSESRNDAQHIS